MSRSSTIIFNTSSSLTGMLITDSSVLLAADSAPEQKRASLRMAQNRARQRRGRRRRHENEAVDRGDRSRRPAGRSRATAVIACQTPA
jgi:hypothetical protein